MIRTLAVAFLVHHMTDSSECDETSKLFHQIDTNCDGRIQKEELIDGLIKYWKVSRSQATKDANEIFSNLDTDQNGYIEYEEFVRAAIDPDCLVQTNYMKFAFDYLDRDKSGQITIDEIVKRLAQNAKNAKDCSKIESEVKNMFKDIDTSGDGKISFNEFCKMMETLFSY
jgi:calcium-dependent protein kinase